MNNQIPWISGRFLVVVAGPYVPRNPRNGKDSICLSAPPAKKGGNHPTQNDFDQSTSRQPQNLEACAPNPKPNRRTISCALLLSEDVTSDCATLWTRYESLTTISHTWRSKELISARRSHYERSDIRNIRLTKCNSERDFPKSRLSNDFRRELRQNMRGWDVKFPASHIAETPLGSWE